MSIVTQHPELINLPADRDAYRAFVRGLDEASRRLLFGVPPGAVTFRCPTNGRLYLDEAPIKRDGCLWTRCYWCDTMGRVRGESRDFDRNAPQPHANEIVEEDDAAPQALRR